MNLPNQSTAKQAPSFNKFGIIVFSIILWIGSQSATGNIRNIINGFLGVLLLSMVVLNWKNILPIFIKN